MGDSFEFLMQLRIDTMEATRQMSEVISNFKKHAAEGATVKIKPDMDLDAVKTEVLGLVAQLSKVTDEIEAAEKAMYDLRKEADKAGDELEKELVGSAEKLEGAFRDSADAAKKVMDELRKEVGQSAIEKHLKALDRAAQNVSNKWLKSTGESDPVKAVGSMLTKQKQTLRERNRLTKSLAGATEGEATAIQSEIDELNRELNAIAKSLNLAFPKPGDLDRVANAFKEVNSAAKAGERLGKKMSAFLELLTRIDAGIKPVPGLYAKAGNVANRAERLAVYGRGLVPTGPTPKPATAAPVRPTGGTAATGNVNLEELAGKLAGIGVVANPEKLVASINSILAEHKFYAHIEAHAGHLIDSVREAIGIINKTGGMKVNVSGLANGAQSAAAGAATLAGAGRVANGHLRLYKLPDGSFTADREQVKGSKYDYLDVPRQTAEKWASGNIFASNTRFAVPGNATISSSEEAPRRRSRQERRGDDIEMMNNKNWAEKSGHTPEGVASFLNHPAIKPIVSEEFKNHVQNVLDYYTKKGTPEEMAHNATKAYGSVDPIKEFLTKDAGGGELAKEMLNRFRVGFGAEFMTELENRFKHVRDHGPSRDPKGALAGVDYAGQALFRDEWRKRYEGIMSQANTFGMNVNDHGTDRLRNRWQEQTKAYLQYQNTLQRYEKTALELAQAQTMEHQRDAHVRLQGIQEAIQAQEVYLATSVLSNRGQIKVDGKMVDKDRAYLGIHRTLDQTFGKDMQAFNAGKSVDQQVGRRQYLAGLFSNNKEIAESYLRSKHVADELFDTEQKRSKELERQISFFRKQYEIAEKLDDEVAQQVKRLDSVKRAGNRGGLESYKDTIRNGFALFGGISLGYTAVNGIRNSINRYMDFQQEIAGIQGVLKSRNPDEARGIGRGVAEVASKYGMSLTEAARAARMLAQSGMDATKVVEELDHTMMASRGMGMTIEQVENLQIAIKAIVDSNEQLQSSGLGTVAVLEKISRVEAAYAVESKDLADAVTLISPVLDQFTGDMNHLTDVFDQTNGLITVMVERLRITGTQAANALKMMFARLQQPEILKKLQLQFGAKLGDGKGDMLPLDQMVAALGVRFKELQKTDPIKAKQFAVALSGGRNVSQITTVLEQFTRVQDIAVESSYAWGAAQDRAAIGVDTMKGALEQAKTSFDLFVNSMLDGTYIGKGFQKTLSGMASVMRGAGGTGAGSLTAIIGTLLGGSAIKFGKNAYDVLAASRAAGSGVFEHLLEQKGKDKAGKMLTMLAGWERGSGVAAKATGKFGQALGGLATFFTPGGVLIAGVLAAAAAIGLISKMMDGGAERANKYRTHIKSLEELKIWDAPQMKNFSNMLIGNEAEGIQGIGFNTVETGYKTIRDTAITGKPRELLDRFEKRVADAGGFKKFRENNAEELYAFQREFTKVFIEALPDSVKKSFTSIENEGDRIKKVSEAVGGAAFAANVQIANSIDQVREATNRMVADGIQGIKDLDKARRVTMIQRAYGVFRDAMSGMSLQQELYNDGREVTKGHDVGVLKGMLGSLPGYDKLANSPLGDRVIETALGRAGKGVQAGAVLDDILQLINNAGAGSPVALARKEALIRDTDPTGANNIAVAIYGKKSVTLGESLLAHYQQGMDLGREQAIEDIRKRLGVTIPEAGTLAAADRDLRTPSGKGGSPIDDANATLSWAISKFDDALLTLVKTIYDRVNQMHQEEAFNKKYNLGFDRGQQGLDFARFLDQQVNSFTSDRQFDVVKLQQELATLAKRAFQIPKMTDNPKKNDVIAKERIDLNNQIGQKQKELEAFGSKSVSGVFGNTKEGQALWADMQKKLGDLFKNGVPDGGAVKKWIEALRDGIGRASKDLINLNAARLMQMDIEKEVLQKTTELEAARIPINATITQKAIQQAQGAERQYKIERAIIEERIRQGKEDKDALNRELAKLDVLKQINDEHAAAMNLADAQRTLDQQAKANLDGMLSGFKSTLTNQSIWEAIVNPPGDTSEERARNKAQAIGDVIFNTLNPVFKTITDRFLDNMMTALSDSLIEKSGLMDLLTSPEFKMKQELGSAKMHYDMTLQAGSQVGSVWYNQIITAGQVVAQQWASVLGVSAGAGLGGSTLNSIADASVTGLFPSSGDAGASDKATGELEKINKQIAQSRKDALISGAGMMVGTVGGTMIGGGGKGAQIGSNMGSVGGMIIGNMIAPGPIGMAIGAGLGGLLGGLLGGSGDKKNKSTNPVIKGLDAIERAQRETITTIQAQTDALIKPENRLLALPADFSIPGYMPSNGLGGGGSNRVTQVAKIEINIPVQNNSNPKEIADQVEEAVGRVLYDQNRNRSW